VHWQVICDYFPNELVMPLDVSAVSEMEEHLFPIQDACNEDFTGQSAQVVEQPTSCCHVVHFAMQETIGNSS